MFTCMCKLKAYMLHYFILFLLSTLCYVDNTTHTIIRKTIRHIVVNQLFYVEKVTAIKLKQNNTVCITSSLHTHTYT